MSRFSRLYREIVLAPLAEQLGIATDIKEALDVVDVMCDGGTMTAELLKRLGRAGSVTVFDTDIECLTEVESTLRNTSLTVTQCTHESLPFNDGKCDRAVCLLTLGYSDAPMMIEEMHRVTRPGGRVVIMTYRNPVHEVLLVTAITAVTGTVPEYSAPLFAEVPAKGMHTEVVRDVVRFDGAHHYWDALVAGRGLQATLSSPQLAEVRAQVERDLEPFTFADGTLRIPIDVAISSSDR